MRLTNTPWGWHKWFAWRPVLANTGIKYDWIWWETIERNWRPDWNPKGYEYRRPIGGECARYGPGGGGGGGDAGGV